MIPVPNDKMKKEYDKIKLRHQQELKEFRDKWRTTKHNAQSRMNGERKISAKERIKNDLMEKQEYKCPICTEYLFVPALDHCHKRLQVREVLCTGCNTALGKFKDSVEILQNAIDYIKIHEEIYKSGNFNKWT